MQKAASGGLAESWRGGPNNGDISSRTENEEGRLDVLTLQLGRCSLPAESQSSRTSSEKVNASAGVFRLGGNFNPSQYQSTEVLIS